MESFLPFFLLLFAGVVFSALSQKLHLPWVVALIVAGVLIGPEGFALVEVNDTFDLLAQVGLVFLMFMAGLETKLSGLWQNATKGLMIALVHGVGAFLIGYGVGWWLGLDQIVSMLIGVIFISTSVAVVVPSLESMSLVSTKVGKTIVAAAVFADVAALFIFSFLLQQVQPTATMPLPILYGILIATLVALRVVLPRLESFFGHFHPRKDQFQQEVRTVLAAMIGTVIVLEILGVHPLIAGFFAGLVLSDTIDSKLLEGKVRALSYGFFIPTFFIVVGLTTSVSIFLTDETALIALVVLTLGALLAKLITGWLGALVAGFGACERRLIAVATLPQLSTTLAVVVTAQEFNLMSSTVASALVALGIVTTLVGPMMMRWCGCRV